MTHPTTPDPTALLRAATDRPTTYLGPAEVLDAHGAALRVRLEDGTESEVDARVAMTFPYEPTPGDSLLVLGQDEDHFAVGVLHASRPQALTFHGDAELRTIGGRLTLASDHSVELRAPRVTVHAGLLRRIAGRVVEKADELRRWVRGTLSLRAGNSRRTIDGDDTTRCHNSTTLAKDTVKIDGDQLHLGH